ncbi:MAG: nucleotidyltransferase [Vicinamibacterales bacterium]
METSSARAIHDPAADFYIDALRKLQTSTIPFLVGGAFAFSHHARVPRDTKDIDVFVRPEDAARVLEFFEGLGYQTERPYPHWLAKIRSDVHFMDIIFSSGNGVAKVDDLWFDHARKTNVLGIIVRIAPAEEMIWSKAFIQERERYDGADVAHLLRETGPSLDWPRLLMRFGDYWRVLLSHLILFGFTYPDKRQNIPSWVMEELVRRLTVSRPNLQSDVCYGTLLSREQYLYDVEHLKYRDARLEPHGLMTAEQLKIWTAAIPGRASDGSSESSSREE